MSFFDTTTLTVAGWTTGAACGVYKGCRLAASALTAKHKVAAAALILGSSYVLTGVCSFIKPHLEETESAKDKLIKFYETEGGAVNKIVHASRYIFSLPFETLHKYAIKIATHDTTTKALGKAADSCAEARERAGRREFSAIKLTVTGWALGAVYGVYKGCSLFSSAPTTQHKVKAAALILGSVNVLANFLYIVKANSNSELVSHLDHWCDSTFNENVFVKIFKATAGIHITVVTDLGKYATTTEAV